MLFLCSFKKRWTLGAFLAFSVFLVGGASKAFSYTHSYINSFRSSVGSTVYVEQSLDGEYGQFQLKGRGLSTAEEGEPGIDKALWQGVGLRTSVGIEIMKFIQFSAGHTFLNMRNQGNGIEQLDGSRFHGEVKVVFGAPIGNLEVGGGASVTRADYQRGLNTASFVGSGVFYSAGVNYFLSSRLSVILKGKSFKDNLMRNSGSAGVQNIKTATSAASLGFRIWM